MKLWHLWFSGWPLFNKYKLHSQYLLKINLLDDFLLIYFLLLHCCMQDLISPPRDQTHAPCSGSEGILNTELPGNSAWWLLNKRLHHRIIDILSSKTLSYSVFLHIYYIIMMINGYLYNPESRGSSQIIKNRDLTHDCLFKHFHYVPIL